MNEEDRRYVAHISSMLSGMIELKALFREKFWPYGDDGNPRQWYCEIYERWRDLEYETWCAIDSVFHERIKEEEETLRIVEAKIKAKMNEEDE